MAGITLSEDEINKLTDLFGQVDKDGDGLIGAEELVLIYKHLGENKSAAELADLVSVWSTSEDSTKISLQELLALRSQEGSNYDGEAEAAFKLFDANGDGQITKDELAQGLEQIGQVFSKQQIDVMFKDADSNGDGYIDFKEFQSILSNGI